MFGGNTVGDPVLEVIREIVGYSNRDNVQVDLSSHRSTLHRRLDHGRKVCSGELVGGFRE